MSSTVDPAVAAGAADAGGAGDGGSQTDEQILGLADGSPGAIESDERILDSPAAEKTPEEPTAEKTPEQLAADAATAAAAGKADLSHIPEKYREMAKTDPELQAVFADRKAFAELGTVEQIKTQRDEWKAFDAGYYSKDPATQGKFTDGQYAKDPEAAVGAYRAMSRTIAAQAPEQYAALAGEVLSATLRGANFDAFATSAREEIAKAPDSPLKAMLGDMVDWLGANAGVGLSKEQQIAAREKALNDGEAATIEQQVTAEKKSFETFNDGWSKTMRDAGAKAIGETLDKLLPSEFPATMRARIATEIAADVEKTLAANASVQEQIAALYRQLIPATYNPKGHKGPVGMKLTPENQQAFVSYLSEQSKPLITAAAAKILPEWTKNFIAAKQGRSAKAATVAGRVDIESSGGSAGRAGTKKGDVDTRGMTDEQIFALP